MSEAVDLARRSMMGGGHDDIAFARLRALGEPARETLVSAMSGTAFHDDTRFACAWALVLCFPTAETLASVVAFAQTLSDEGTRDILVGMARNAARRGRRRG